MRLSQVGNVGQSRAELPGIYDDGKHTHQANWKTKSCTQTNCQHVEQGQKRPEERERSFQGCQMQTKPQNVAFNCNYWIVLQLQPKSKSLTHTQYPSPTRLFLLILLLLLMPCPVRFPSRSTLPRCWYNNCNRILFVKPNWFIFLLHSSGTLSPHVAERKGEGEREDPLPLQGIARQHVNRSIYAE